MKPIINKVNVSYALFVIVITALWGGWSTRAQGQNASQQIRYALRGDSVFVYHIKSLNVGQGFNIYRKTAGDTGFVKLNEKPVRGITYASELPSALGDHYDDIRKEMGASGMQDAFFKLRGNAVMGRLYTFVYPEVAKALGRLYIDTGVNPGSRVTYKIEIVNDLGQPTGQTFSHTFQLSRHTIRQPTDVSVENDGYAVTANWKYPQMRNEDDKVIRFALYRKDPGSQQVTPINHKIVIRDVNKTDYQLTFQAERLGRELQYFVRAVDITGQEGPRSALVTHFLKDNIAPSVITGVKGEYVDGAQEITWPVSPEPDVAGYRVYRSTDIREGYEPLNSTLIETLNPIYRDSTLQEGQSYYYKVTALDSAGNESERSASVMKRMVDKTPPAMVQDLRAQYRQEEGTVQLNWTLEPMAPDLRRFIVLRRREDGNADATYAQLTPRDFRDQQYIDQSVAGKDFTEGAYYRYGLVSADSSRNFSDTAFVNLQIPDVTPPEAPSFVEADNKDGIRVNLTWNSTPSADAVQYLVFRQPLDSAQSQIAELGVDKISLRDEKVKLGEHYRYGVSAVDSVGNQSKPTYSDTVWVRDYDPPRQVRNVSLHSTSDGLQIRWEPVVAFDLKGYKVYQSNISTGVYEPLTEQPIEQTEWMDNDPQNEHWYRVVAVDISGNESRPSEPVKYEE